MKRPDEQRGLFSRLPDDPEYWQSLTDRIVTDARADLRMYGVSRRKWWSEIAQFSTILALGATAAVFASALLLPWDGSGEVEGPTADAYGLAPDDPLAVTLVSGEAPPALEFLMAVRTAESTR